MSTPLPDKVQDDKLHQLVMLEQNKASILSSVVVIPSAFFVVGVAALFMTPCEDCEGLAQRIDNVFAYGILVLIVLFLSLLRLAYFIWTYSKAFHAEHTESGQSRTQCGCKERRSSPTILRIKVELSGRSQDVVFIQFRCRHCDSLVGDRMLYKEGIGHGCEDISTR